MRRGTYQELVIGERQHEAHHLFPEKIALNDRHSPGAQQFIDAVVLDGNQHPTVDLVHDGCKTGKHHRLD